MLSLSEMKAGAKVFRDSANQERRLHPRGMKIHASIEVVVFAVGSRDHQTSLPCKNSSCSNCGSEQNGMRWSRICSSSAFPVKLRCPRRPDRAQDRDCARQKGCATGIPSSARNRTLEDTPPRPIRSRESRAVSAFQPVTPSPCRKYRSGECVFCRS